MRIAIISDIHGNLAALDAVLADVQFRQVDLIFNLGDAISGPLLPVETADRLMALNIPAVRGNHERQLLTLNADKMGFSDRFTLSRLTPTHLKWIAGFPRTMSPLDEVLLVHGTPLSDVEYFLHTVDHTGLRPSCDTELEARADNESATLIMCGHSHIPGKASLGGKRLVVNPGSVGLQAYSDHHPFPHKVENGSPHARYCVIEKCRDEWLVTFVAVAYDWESMATMAEDRGCVDWARALRTGLI